MTARYVTTQSKMSLVEQALAGGQALMQFVDKEEVRKRDIRVNQALSMLKSTNFTWCQSPIKVLQNKLRILALDWTVFEEDPILFCTFKQRLSGKFRGNLKKYQPLLSLINQRHWLWQFDMMWEIFFNRPIQEDSCSMIEILINLSKRTQTDCPLLRKGSVLQIDKLLIMYDIVKVWSKWKVFKIYNVSSSF